MPKSVTLYGVKIEKMKTGRFIEALQNIQDLPIRIIEKVFGGDVDAALKELKTIDKRGLSQLLCRVLTVVPNEAVELINHFVGVENGKILDLTPKELTDVLIEWYKVNDLSDFFGNARRLKQLVAHDFGFNDSLPSESQSD